MMGSMNTYLLTGAGRKGRIGHAVARRLLSRGDSVILSLHSDRSAYLDLARDFPGRVAEEKADLSDPEEGALLMARRGGEIAGVVYLASVFRGHHTDAENLTLHCVTPSAMAEEWKRRGGRGAFILFGDALCREGKPSAYKTSREEAAEMLAPLALECAPEVRVNMVSPGIVLPGEGDEAFFREREKTLPLGRRVRVEDVVSAVLLLLDAPSLVGIDIPVDGGAHLQRPAGKGPGFLYQEESVL